MQRVIDTNINESPDIRSINDRLEQISIYLEQEISYKQRVIEELQEEVGGLKAISEEKNALISKLETQLLECRQTYEGTRQLINKLLNDISNYQKDIEWYKRTYIKRSLPGTIWQKLFKK
jgi:chromosome segregation ATPase